MSGGIIFHQSDDGTIRLETRLENETLWLTQQQMAELFQTSKQNISHHIRSIYAEGELAQPSRVRLRTNENGAQAHPADTTIR